MILRTTRIPGSFDITCECKGDFRLHNAGKEGSGVAIEMDCMKCGKRQRLMFANELPIRVSVVDLPKVEAFDYAKR